MFSKITFWLSQKLYKCVTIKDIFVLQVEFEELLTDANVEVESLGFHKGFLTIKYKCYEFAFNRAKVCTNIILNLSGRMSKSR